MDDRHFDFVTRVLGSAPSRRLALQGLASAALGMAAGGLFAGDEAEAGRNKRRRRRRCGKGKKKCRGKCIKKRQCCKNRECGDCEVCRGKRCTSVCVEGQTCINGLCTCAGESCSGCCDGVTCLAGTSDDNCGTNGAECTSCATGQTCQGGVCVCNASSCAGCCDGNTCRGGGSSNACGQGGVACDECGENEACTEGQCACPLPFTVCGNDCVNLDTNSNNCGECGNTCIDGATCESGQCVVKVRPSNLSGWFGYNDETDQVDNSLVSFVSGPDPSPNGVGSVEITVSGPQRRNIATYQFSATPLSTIVALSYSTYNSSAGNGTEEDPGSPNRSGYLQFNVDFDGSDAWQRRLYFLPKDNGTVQQDTWQTWDTIAGGNAMWGYSGPTWPDDNLPNSTKKSWGELLQQYPGIRIRLTDSWLGIRVGEPYEDGYTENIATLTFGTANTTTRFEFVPD